MQRLRTEHKDSAARTRSHRATSSVDVIVLTTDTALLATLREAAGPGKEIFAAESPESAVDLLLGGHCGILVIDVAVVRRNVAELVEKLQSQFPEVVLLATGRREEQNAVTPLVGSGRIYRFLHKPVSPARAELFLSAATRRHAELHYDARSTFAVGALAVARNRKVLGMSTAAIAVVAAAVWLALTTNTEAPEPAHVAAPVEVQPQATIAELLANADAAYATGNVLPPASGNALDLYRSVLQIESSNREAAAAVDRIVAAVATQAKRAIAARDLPRARERFATLQRIAPAHSQLDSLQNALATLSRSVASPSRPASVPATRTAKESPAAPNAPGATPNLDLAKAYLAANQLTEPLDANALGQLRRARAAGEDESALQIAATDLGTRLLNKALTAVDSGEVSGANALYEAASGIDREFETALPDLDAVAQRIRDAQNKAKRTGVSALLERATQLRLAGQLLEPAGENAFEALQAALSEDPSSADARTEQQQLTFALLEHTRTALAAGDIDRADVLATRAEEVSPGLSQTRTLREQIGAARTQRLDAATILQAARLPRRRETPAVYPREALLNKVEGWVDLEFTISAAGVPSDIMVKAAQPDRTFDVAALQALRQWRFEPIIRDGTPRAHRAALRMEFRLKG